MSHHRDICSYLGVKNLSPLSIYPHSLPLLRQRVKLAKQVSISFQQYFFVFMSSFNAYMCILYT
jgi:hypothetical protein